MSEELSPRAKEIRRLIRDYIDGRLEPKVEKERKQLSALLEEEAAYLESVQSGETEVDHLREEEFRTLRVALETKISDREAEYETSLWFERAVRDSNGIQIVTHPIKAMYPNAHIKDSSNFFVEPKSVVPSSFVTSRCLGDEFAPDNTGNAAGMYVYVFLNLRFEDKTLLELFQRKDPDALRAVHADPEKAHEIGAAFVNVTESRTQGIASSVGAKQIYWFEGDDPKNDEDYCLLAPLYPSHLSHAMHAKIQAHRFSDEAKAAREARSKKRVYEGEAFDYPNLARLNIGGANPQGVSYLINLQRGVNYLLPSLPPVFTARAVRPVWGRRSIFELFERRGSTQRTYAAFRKFLASDPPANQETRVRVARFVEELIDDLVGYVRAFQELEEPWTADERCQLRIEEQLWLNPMRAVHDDEFYARWQDNDWVNAIGTRFAAYLNKALAKALPMGDIEKRHWLKEFYVDDEWSYRIERARKLKEASA